MLKPGYLRFTRDNSIRWPLYQATRWPLYHSTRWPLFWLPWALKLHQSQRKLQRPTLVSDQETLVESSEPIPHIRWKRMFKRVAKMRVTWEELFLNVPPISLCCLYLNSCLSLTSHETNYQAALGESFSISIIDVILEGNHVLIDDIILPLSSIENFCGFMYLHFPLKPISVVFHKQSNELNRRFTLHIREAPVVKCVAQVRVSL